MPEKLSRAESELEQLEKSLSSAIDELAHPFEYQEELERGIERQAELNAQLNLEDKPEETVMEENEIMDEVEHNNVDASADEQPQRTGMSDYALEQEVHSM